MAWNPSPEVQVARADAHALNAAYQLGRRTAEEAVRSAYDHIRMTAIPGGNGHFLVPEAAIAEMRSALFPPGDAPRRESLVSARVTRPADPVGRNPDACTNELATDIENVDDESGADLCTRCGAQIDHNEPHTECDACRVGGEA